MNTTNKPLLTIFTALIIGLAALSLSACGKKGDLYMPVPPAEVKTTTTTQPEPAQIEPEKEDKEKKDSSQTTE